MLDDNVSKGIQSSLGFGRKVWWGEILKMQRGAKKGCNCPCFNPFFFRVFQLWSINWFIQNVHGSFFILWSVFSKACLFLLKKTIRSESIVVQYLIFKFFWGNTNSKLRDFEPVNWSDKVNMDKLNTDLIGQNSMGNFFVVHLYIFQVLLQFQQSYLIE